MDTYSFLREFADSWFLLAMFAFFIGVGIWAFWPGQRAARQEAAEIPLRDEVPICDRDRAERARETDSLEGPNDG